MGDAVTSWQASDACQDHGITIRPPNHHAAMLLHFYLGAELRLEGAEVGAANGVLE